MSYRYYRFYFLETGKVESLISSDMSAQGIIRISLDLDSAEKSISILCEAEEALETQRNKLRRLLWEQYQVLLSDKVEEESLDDEQHCEHDHAHDHHGHGHDHHGHHHHHHHDHHENHWLKAALGLTCGVLLFVMAIAGFNIPMIAYYIITGLSVLMTLFLGRSVYQSAWHALRNRQWDMATLYTVSTLAIIAISVVSIFVPGLPMILESAPFILGFWHLGEAIEHTLLDKIHTKLDVRDCAPQSVTLKGKDKQVSVKQLMPNDVVSISPGEVLAIDGVLLAPALLYTTRINGSPYPQQFKAGDEVKAGMCLVAEGAALEMRVTKSYEHSYLSLVAKNINEANNKKAPIERFANKILRYFVPGLLVVAIISGIVIGLLFPPVLAIQCVIAVLVSACPCALSLITPMAVKIGMKKAAEHGVHFKDGATLQAAAAIDTVVFDLNGTLTQGKISIERLVCEDESVLKHIALLERHSTHPLARVIRAYIAQRYPSAREEDELTLSEVNCCHHGIQGVMNGKRLMVGNHSMLTANGIKIKPPYHDPKQGSIYIVRGNAVIGQIAHTDPLREDAKKTIEQLKKQGKTIHLCTGAGKEVAESYAALLGIPKENLSVDNKDSASKARYIEQLQRRGHQVAMVGDALNDIEAIEASTIGIAVKSTIGQEIVEQSAGIVVAQGLLFPIATALDVATKTKTNIFQNLFVSLTYNSMITLVAAGLFIVLGFALNPAIGVALMVLESALVLANLYRLKQSKTVAQPLVCQHPASGGDSPTDMLGALGAQTQQTPRPLQQSANMSFFCAPGERVPANSRTTHDKRTHHAQRF